MDIFLEQIVPVRLLALQHSTIHQMYVLVVPLTVLPVIQMVVFRVQLIIILYKAHLLSVFPHVLKAYSFQAISLGVKFVNLLAHLAKIHLSYVPPAMLFLSINFYIITHASQAVLLVPMLIKETNANLV